jgi:thiol-disulfide isomerase/thioredoxin
MVQTLSHSVPLGTSAPPFRLVDVITKKEVALEDFADGKPLVVMFICNHCPFVKMVKPELTNLARDYQPRGVHFVAINSNDVQQYPDDSPEKMAEDAKEFGYPFPYLFDETQEVAKAYGAACTPDFFIYDGDRKLVYHGQLDDARPGNGKPVTGQDVREALNALLEGRSVSRMQKPSLGCNIKWKPGNEPPYFTAGRK